MVYGYQLSQAVYVVAKLGIADLLEDGPLTVAELASATETHAPSLYRVLRTLASVGVFTLAPDGRFGLALAGNYLRTEGPDSMRAYAIMHGEPWFRQGWNLLQSVSSGKAGFHLAHGVGFFEYLAQHPAASELFDRAMSGAAPQRHRDVVATHDFSGIKTLVDVGGGNGSLLAAILRANPQLRGILFDRPHVVAGAARVLAEAGVADRCRIESGDFFTTVPKGGDAYVLATVIHDWDDGRAKVILENCAEAMGGRDKLLLVERVIGEESEGSTVQLLSDLNMMVLLGGRERTEEEFRELLGTAGFDLKRIIPTPRIFSIIEAAPV